MNDSTVSSPQPPWLLLIHRLPPRPDYLRVKFRRRLDRLGAVPLKNSVYLLPHTDQTLEDLQWLAREIDGDGGTAVICEARFLYGATDDEIAGRLQESEQRLPTRPRHRPPDRVRPGSTWVTRRDVYVDRIASAWLIRRFIDRKARFRLVALRGYRPRKGELRFDMFEAEYGHEGDRCTFETLLRRFAIKDRALDAVAQVVHDIDLKDGKFGRPEAAGVKRLIDGVIAASPEDPVRLERGAEVFAALYASFGGGGR